MKKMRSAQKIWIEKPEGKKPLGRPKRRGEDNISMDLMEMGRKVWTGCMWLMIGASGRLLLPR
jgi:hypothetical protein